MNSTPDILSKRKLVCKILHVLNIILCSETPGQQSAIYSLKMRDLLDEIVNDIRIVNGLELSTRDIFRLIFSVYDCDYRINFFIEYLAYKNVGFGYCEELKSKWEMVKGTAAEFEFELIIKLYYDSAWSEGVIKELIDPQTTIEERWGGFFSDKSSVGEVE